MKAKSSFGHSLKIVLEQFAKLEPIPISLIHCLPLVYRYRKTVFLMDVSRSIITVFLAKSKLLDNNCVT